MPGKRYYFKLKPQLKEIIMKLVTNIFVLEKIQVIIFYYDVTIWKAHLVSDIIVMKQMLEFQGVPGYNSDKNCWNTIDIITSKVLTSPTRWADSTMLYWQGKLWNWFLKHCIHQCNCNGKNYGEPNSINNNTKLGCGS